MYEDHYGLTTRPFALTPDPRFWVETATHRKAMAYLGYGLAQQEGFIVITGEIGAGKTTLVAHLLETLAGRALHVVKIVSSQVDPDDLLRTVADGMGVATATLAKADLLKAIERQLHAIAREGRRTLLVVDEVQALPTASLEELRMLSNFQAAGHALLQILLLGQPEFRERVAEDGLEQLRQRVIATHHLTGMDADEVELYVAHRLSVAGWQGRPDFDPPALAAMHGWSGGIPRRLNLLASRVLLHGAIEGIDAFGAADIAAVIADLEGRAREASPAPAPTERASNVIEWPIPREPAPLAAKPVVEEIVAAGEAGDRAELPYVAEAEPEAESVEAEIVEAEGIEGDIVEADIIDAEVFEAKVIEPAEVEPEVEVEIAAPEPAGADAAEPALAEPQTDAATLEARVVALEAQVLEQDAALRRVLTLLVDWVETDDRRRDHASAA